MAWDPTGLARYSWWALIAVLFGAQAKICDDYFVPAIEACSTQLKIPQDVAGATLMAFGCNGPEMFVNGVALFVTHSDVGTGTIVGSEIFNLLCIVAGGAALVAPLAPLPVKRYAFTRDVAFYAAATLLLGAVLVDGEVTRLEAGGLLSMAGVYALGVSQTPALLERFGVARCSNEDSGISHGSDGLAANGTPYSNAELECRIECGVGIPASTRPSLAFECRDDTNGTSSATVVAVAAATTSAGSLGGGGFNAWVRGCATAAGDAAEKLLSPLDHALRATVPDCKAGDKFTAPWAAAFALSMAWLALFSYAVCWTADQLTVDFGLPSAVVGLTVGAVGMSFANLWASLIEARRGNVEMAVSNALGSNIQNVFIALSVPWMLWFVLNPGESSLFLNADGIEEGVAVMGATLAAFVAATLFGEAFTIDKLTAKVAIGTYLAYLVYACAPALLE